MVSTDSKIEFYVSFILRGRIKHKMDEVMNKTYCNLIQTLLENKQIKDAIKDKAVKILERVTFVGDLEKAISTLNPRYIRKRNQSNCKRTKNTPGISHMISASSSVMDFVSKSGPRVHKSCGCDLATPLGRSAVLLSFFYFTEHRGLCMRSIAARTNDRVGRFHTQGVGRSQQAAPGPSASPLCFSGKRSDKKKTESAGVFFQTRVIENQ